MSANIDTMLYVGETPWHGLGVKYDTAPETPEEIIRGAKLDWEVKAEEMKTDMYGRVPNHYALYRQDNSELLGVVNKARPVIVQNVNAFNSVETLLGNGLTVDTAASLGHGEKVFGCFLMSEKYKLLDDDVEHYFVIVNDHLRADGKVTVLNTPIRVVCQNTLSAALNNNVYKLRVPISDNRTINSTVASTIVNSAGIAIKSLQERAEKMATTRVDKLYVEKVLDELFPYIKADGESLHSKANEKTEMIRNTFINDCMGADNLANYRGTQFQIFNALTDYTQHYFTDVDKGYDLNHRMKTLPGFSSDSSAALVTKYLKMADKLIA